MNALQEIIGAGRFLTLPEIHESAEALVDKALESQPALLLYVAAQQMEELAALVKSKTRELAVGEALTGSGGAMQGVEYHGVNVALRNLPAKWDGYSDEVYKLEAQIDALKKELAAVKKLEQTRGQAMKAEQGVTLAITFKKD